VRNVWSRCASVGRQKPTANPLKYSRSPKGHVMTSLAKRLPEGNDESDTSREEFLQWHYSHPKIYLTLKRIALKERESGRTTILMSRLFDLYEESLVKDGRIGEIVPRHYACFYRKLLSSNPYLWAFLKMHTARDTEKAGRLDGSAPSHRH